MESLSDQSADTICASIGENVRGLIFPEILNVGTKDMLLNPITCKHEESDGRVLYIGE